MRVRVIRLLQRRLYYGLGFRAAPPMAVDVRGDYVGTLAARVQMQEATSV